MVKECGVSEYPYPQKAIGAGNIRLANRVWGICTIHHNDILIYPASTSLLMLLPHMAEKHNWSRLSGVANPLQRPLSIPSELFMSQSGVYTYALVQFSA
jgi:hypothetical protein